jgi:hypothetical protein
MTRRIRVLRAGLFAAVATVAAIAIRQFLPASRFGRRTEVADDSSRPDGERLTRL